MVYIITWKHVFTPGEDEMFVPGETVVLGPLKIPTSLKDCTYKPDVSNTADSPATISRVHIDILPTERRNSVNDGLVQERIQLPPPRCPNELKVNVIFLKKRCSQENSKSSALLKTIPTSSPHYVTGVKQHPVKPLQPLNKDQNLPKTR